MIISIVFPQLSFRFDRTWVIHRKTGMVPSIKWSLEAYIIHWEEVVRSALAAGLIYKNTDPGIGFVLVYKSTDICFYWHFSSFLFFIFFKFLFTAKAFIFIVEHIRRMTQFYPFFCIGGKKSNDNAKKININKAKMTPPNPPPQKKTQRGNIWSKITVLFFLRD